MQEAGRAGRQPGGAIKGRCLLLYCNKSRENNLKHILSSRGSGKTSKNEEDEKQRLKLVTQYCENVSTCRSRFLETLLEDGQGFDKDCNRCDVCKPAANRDSCSFVKDVKKVRETFKKLVYDVSFNRHGDSTRDRITLNQAIQVLMGRTVSKKPFLKDLPQFGICTFMILSVSLLC